MQFYLDEDLSHQVAIIARARRLDAVSSHECGRNSLPDEQQLLLAAEEGRCFVTRNAKHLIPLTTAFAEQELPHAGLLIVPRTLPNDQFARIAAALVAFAREHEGDDLRYAILYLSAPP